MTEPRYMCYRTLLPSLGHHGALAYLRQPQAVSAATDAGWLYIQWLRRFTKSPATIMRMYRARMAILVPGAGTKERVDMGTVRRCGSLV